ncbi:MAG: TlpA family protein disulfide reductase [Myxococcales bacterium]|nr:TlpA family protein disulfide reductase [Myxococcales bacterium]MCB9736101.1 TlpA family protein disulfide reductase [Deltaproteobacteria bacterium]
MRKHLIGHLFGAAAAVVVAGLVTACASAPTAGELPDQSAVAEVSLVDVDGNPHSLAEFRGKVVLLDFWATWCAPCLESLPLYDTWQQDLGDQGLVVVAVSVDEEDAPVASFAAKYAPHVTVLRDAKGDAASRFGLPKMPTAFVLDRSGRIVEAHPGFSEEEAQTLRKSLVQRLAAP